MHLTLFVPDLLWPDVENAAAFDLPATTELSRFLAVAVRTETPLAATDSWESLLARLFGFIGPQPLAQLRARGDALDSSTAASSPSFLDWQAIGLCADPVNLAFVQQSLVLSPISPESLSSDDIRALLTSLNEEFRGEGRFVVAPEPQSQDHWYFIPEATCGPLPDLAACSRLAGRRIDADETRQILNRQTLQWLNRIQMCLNDHPVNATREAQGLVPVNSLWPWGAGTFTTPPATGFTSATGNASLLKGLCLATDIPRHTAPQMPDCSGDHLVTELSLATAVQNDDLAAWQEALQRLEKTWVSPALAALEARAAALTSLRIISIDAHRVRDWMLDRKTLRASKGGLKHWLGLKPAIPALSRLVRSW